MKVIERLRQQCQARPKRVIFPETIDRRVIEAATELHRLGLAKPMLVIAEPLEMNVKVPSDIEIVQPTDDDLADRCAEQLFENRKHKGLSQDAARLAIDDPLLFASLLVRIGVADAGVAGSIATTASVIRAGLYGIGMEEGQRLVSSFFLMQFPNYCWTYADCGVVPNPSADELAAIAINAAINHERLTQQSPRVAMLSFSTLGSAEHSDVKKVRQATELVRKQKPELAVEGELQFDAAMNREVAQRKAPDSKVAGQANVFVFPDLDAGNIAYKITERLGGAQALGPLIQGLRRPFMDLSRGCSVEDIINVAVVASAMA